MANMLTELFYGTADVLTLKEGNAGVYREVKHGAEHDDDHVGPRFEIWPCFQHSNLVEHHRLKEEYDDDDDECPYFQHKKLAEPRLASQCVQLGGGREYVVLNAGGFCVRIYCLPDSQISDIAEAVDSHREKMDMIGSQMDRLTSYLQHKRGSKFERHKRGRKLERTMLVMILLVTLIHAISSVM